MAHFGMEVLSLSLEYISIPRTNSRRFGVFGMGVQGPDFEYEVIQQTMFIGTSTLKHENSFLNTKNIKC